MCMHVHKLRCEIAMHDNVICSYILCPLLAHFTLYPLLQSEVEQKQKRGPFRKFFYRGLEVHKLLDLSDAELLQLLHARARRRLIRVATTNSMPAHLVRKLRNAKRAVKGKEDKPQIIKTHLRNYIVVPEMVTAVVGVYNGLGYHVVEIKPDMIGHYLAEFSITYQPVKHGRTGAGAGHGSRFIPLS
jgi:small subunit ribosomal protein S15e